jgi:L-threonylcarbamoyladenylate synthase
VADDDVERTIGALQRGRSVLLPTDTVYGLVASAYQEAYTEELYRVKGRDQLRPSALMAGTVDQLLECVPELRGSAERIVRALLPGGYTLVLPNPARRFRWLTGLRTDAIGVRVPVLPEESLRVLDAVGCVASTSANDPGGPDPATLDAVPARIRELCGAELDVGPLPGTPSTVIDFTVAEPHVLREGAEPGADAVARVRAALAG